MSIQNEVGMRLLKADTPLSEGWAGWLAANATNLAATLNNGGGLIVPLMTWTITSTPAAATQATATRAVGATGVFHVATTLTWGLTGGALQTPLDINLRDGATGAGTILRTWKAAIPAANNAINHSLSGLAIIGSTATAMTIEFDAAGAATIEQTVSLTGFSVVAY